MNWDYLVLLGCSLLGGMLAYLLMHGILSLRVYRIQCQVADLQNGLLSVRNKGAAESKWAKKAQQDTSMEEFLLANKTPKQARFANDPLGE